MSKTRKHAGEPPALLVSVKFCRNFQRGCLTGGLQANANDSILLGYSERAFCTFFRKQTFKPIQGCKRPAKKPG